VFESGGFTWHTRRAVSGVLVASALLALAACGDDKAAKPSNRAIPNVAARPAAAPTAAATQAAAGTPATPDPAVVAVSARADKNSDVMKWLQLLPDKTKPDAKPAPVVAAAPAPVPVAPPAAEITRSAAASRPAAPAPEPIETPRAIPVVATAPPPVAVLEPPKTNVLRLISREEPTFPREALRAGVRQGHVRVRLSIGMDGSVSQAEVLDASPTHVFDRSVLAAVKGWKYGPLSTPTATTIDFDFNVE